MTGWMSQGGKDGALLKRGPVADAAAAEREARDGAQARREKDPSEGDQN